MRKHRGDVLIIVLSVVLMGLGLLVMYTIGPVRANFLNATYGSSYSDNYFFIHQLISVGISIGIFYLFNKIEYKKIIKYANIMMIIALLSCVVLALAQATNMSIAKCELGACRWFTIAGVSIQPAEFLKFASVIYLATIFTKYKKESGKKGILKNTNFLLRFVGAVGASLFFVVIVQKDLGSGIPIATIALSILFVSGVPIRRFLLVCLAVVVLGVGAVLTSEHRRERLWTYLGFSAAAEEETEDKDAYHIENALIAIGTGGLFGSGIGNSVQATGYLPESINDSVFAIMGETFGFVGLMLILAGFFILLIRVLRVSDYSTDFQNSLIAVGAFAWITTHVVVNIMSMTGITPLTGITLPLLSYGGTSMMMVAAMLGLVYQLSEYTSREVVSDERRLEELGVAREMVSYENINYSSIRRRK
ncbi:FtsW/RodA/SpoVE family cell cycle protein [Candidatus Saccharibacteria bacterium]|nr:FtsW/RodA/SpoVE family cell cycle protein [Candidatus Saccharibacteria bacterium]